MSMSLANAKTYVSRILGGAGNSAVKDMAGEAINRAFEDWQAAKPWNFLLKDTSSNTVVTGCSVTDSSADVSAPSTGAFDFVNVGQTVTVSTPGAGNVALPASTTVSSVTRGSNGVVSLITLSNGFTNSGTSDVGLTFSADIPITIGTDDYGLPTDFNSAYSARLITNEKGVLQYIDHRRWDRVTNDQSLQGSVEWYTVYNPYSAQTQNFGTYRLKVFRVPQATDTLRLRYFRSFDKAADPLDIPDEYLYKFLDYARSLLLEVKRAQDDPAGYMSSVKESFQEVSSDDEELVDDSFGHSLLKPGYEDKASGPVWGNGQFTATPDW